MSPCHYRGENGFSFLRAANLRHTAAGFLAAGITFLTWQVDAKGNLAVDWVEPSQAETIDLSRASLAFEENFDNKALEGPKVFAPVHSSFGGSKFDNPNGAAYDVVDGALILKAYKRDGKWRSGSVQTADAGQSAGRTSFDKGRGFACATCYFEARMKFPAGVVRGPWAAFWLLSPEGAKGHAEIDAIEWYGGDPRGHHQTVHIWPKDKKLHTYQSNYIRMDATADGEWHTYGAQIRNGTVYIYMDRKVISSVAVPDALVASYYAVVTLAVLEKEADIAQDPFTIAVDYIRAYDDNP